MFLGSKGQSRYKKHLVFIFGVSFSLFFLIFFALTAYSFSTETTLKIQVDGGPKNIQITGRPLCSGTTGSDGFYDCKRASLLATTLSAPDKIVQGSKAYRFFRWEGCDAHLSEQSENTCSVKVSANSSRRVSAKYFLFSENTVDRALFDGMRDLSVAIGNDGLPIISYFHHDSVLKRAFLKVLKCMDRDCVGEKKITSLDVVNGDDTHTNSIAIGKDGLPIISYYTGSLKQVRVDENEVFLNNGLDGECYEADEDGECDLKVLKCGDKDCTFNNTITTVDSMGSVGNYSSIGIDFLTGLPIISYWEGLGRIAGTGTVTDWSCDPDGLSGDKYCNLKVLKCGNEKCSENNTITRADTSGSVGEYSSILIGKDNLPIISYIGYFYIKVLKCFTADCSGENSIFLVEQSNDKRFKNLSTALNNNGLPFIAYDLVALDTNSNDNLKILKCGNQLCSADNRTINLATKVSARNYMSNYQPSLAIGQDNLPTLSYFEEYEEGSSNQTGDLKVLKCLDESCTSQTKTILDSQNNAGYFSSLKIYPDNRPLIGYVSVTEPSWSSALKIIKCSVSSCELL